MVEFKSPFPQEHLPEEPYYKVPARHIPQLLCDMFYFSSDEIWLICVTRKSVTVIIIYFDEDLFNKLLHITDDLYGKEKLTVPTRLHHDICHIKDDIKQFTKTHCHFVLEVPTFTGELGIIPHCTYESPYSVPPVLHETEVDLGKLQENSRVIAAECRLIFKDSHTCLQELAKEVSTFMLNDKDHMHNDKIPKSAPMAYIMKARVYPQMTFAS